MDFSCTDEQLAIAELAKQMMTDKATPDRLTELEKGEGPRFDRELWSELAKSGVLGIAVPEVFGGAGMGFFELSLIAEQVGLTTAPVPFVETTVMAALPIEKYGSESQKQAFLPGVASGDVVLTAALVEEGADPGVPETRAVANGDGFSLRGCKICVPAGDIAGCDNNIETGRGKAICYSFSDATIAAGDQRDFPGTTSHSGLPFFKGVSKETRLSLHHRPIDSRPSIRDARRFRRPCRRASRRRFPCPGLRRWPEQFREAWPWTAASLP